MAKNRIKMLAALVAVGMSVAACGSTEDNGTSNNLNSENSITIEDNNGELQVPKNPKSVVALDNRSFEILNEWGVELTAAPKKLVPASVTDYKENEGIKDLGNHKEPDFEALVAAQPDLVISGQRFSSHDEEIKKLVPDAAVVELEPREGKPLDEELIRQITTLGEVFGKKDEAEKMVKEFKGAKERAKKAYDKLDGGRKVMAVNVSGGEIGYVAPHVGRVWGPVFDWVGMDPALKVDNASSNHEGDDISVEAIAKAKPDWMLVLDRDGAVNADKPDYSPAADVIKRADALKGVPALKDNHLLVAPQDTYINESITTYTEILNSLADAFEGKK